MAFGGDPDDKPLDPVDLKELMALLQEPVDWRWGKPSGERMTAPANLATASLTKGDATVTAKITDSALK